MNDYRNTVLLIDDDAVSRTYMRLMLQKVEYSVIEAKDGIEGLELYQRLSPALVLLDAKMPGMSGFECCRKIRNLDEGKYVPILMVTGLDDQSSVDEAFLEAGVSDYITKPVQMPILIGRVGHLIRSAEAEHFLRRSEEKYRSLITSLQEVIFQLDKKGRLIFVNPVWSRLMGYSVESSLEMPFEAFLHPAERRRHRVQFDKAWQQSNRCFRYRSRCLNQEGQVRWVEIQLCATTDSDNQVIDISGRLNDITDRTIREQYRNLEYAIARILSNAAETSAAIHRSLQALCGSLGFQFGEFWQMDTSQQKLKCRERWYPNIPSLEEFADFTKTLALEPNEGIPGQSWQSDEPVWVENIFQNDAFVRKQAAERAGFSSVLSCPVSQGIEKLGVIVLFSQMASPPEHDLLRLLTILGRQLSQYMKRKQAEQQIQQQNQLLQSELLQAAKYVESLLPKDSKQFSAGSKAEPSLILRTLFQPSSTLGGDAFDYVWLDPEHLMFHLLDVAGHGVKSALLSVSVLNILRQRTLQNADFYQPNTVLQALNDVFQVNEEGEDYFTCWYGVYNTVSRELTFATAGHPPGVLIMPTDEGWQTQCLDSDGIAIGLFPGMPFEAKKITVLPQSRLYLFSDGVFEIATGKKGEIWGFNAWKEFLRKYTEEQSSSLKPLLTKAQMLNKSSILEDDFSVLEVNFA